MTLPAVEFRYLGICVGIIVSLAGTAGNVMAIAAYYSNPKMKTAFNLIIVHLATVDLFTSSIIIPFIVNGYAKLDWLFSPVSCELFGYFYYSAHYTSAVFLVAISCNRYMHVSRPHAAYRVIYSQRRRRVTAVIMWVFAPLCLLPLLFTDGFGWWQNALLCSYTRNQGFSDVYSLIMRIFFQLFPFMCMVALYGSMFATVKRSHASVDNPKIHVDRCDSSFGNGFTTDTKLAASSPMRSTSNQYELKLSYETSRSPTKSTADTPKYPVVGNMVKPAVNTATEALDWRLREISSETEHRGQAFTTDSADYEVAVLRRQSVSTRHAKLCRRNSSGNIKTLPSLPTSLPEDSENVKVYSLRAVKQRAVTFSNLKNIRTFVERKVSLEPSANTNNTESSNSKAEGNVQTSVVKPLPLPRPRHLSVPTENYHTDITDYLKKQSRFSSRLTKSSFKRKRAFSTAAISKIGTMKSRFANKSKRSVQHAKAQRQLLYMCTVICATFALCALPSAFLNLVTDYDSVAPEVHMATSDLQWLTSMINPIVYAAMNTQFRKEYKKIFARLAAFCCCNSGKMSSKVHPAKSEVKNSIKRRSSSRFRSLRSDFSSR
ncbi:unnamed protein product [Clavelina lepadiformis]|uniref:G-protein coupled receptors family 1 profile domain-containing protein n=1 Tax=Clavelina lepadiformis TaxID=159417 RepID=A0ABP0FGX7_CLALP